MPQEEVQLTRREPLPTLSPFRMLDRFVEEMERVFDDFGLGRGWLVPRWGFDWLRAPSGRVATWAPDIEVLQRNNEIVVRADLPGLTKDDVQVEVTEDAVTIQGERRRAREEEREGVYRSEREYGAFCRVIPLPEGAITDQAKATFKDGVLEVTVPAPPEAARRGRRIEIEEKR
jgi:HSP20 family protein